MVFNDILYIINLIIENKIIYPINVIQFRIINNLNKKLIFIIEGLDNTNNNKTNIKDNNFLSPLYINNKKYSEYSIEEIIIKIIRSIDIYKLLIYIFLNCNQTFKKYKNYLTILKDMFNNPEKYKYNISNCKWDMFINDISNETGNVTLLFKNFVSISYLYIIYKSDILRNNITEYININYTTFLDKKKLYFYNLYLSNHKTWILDNIKIFLDNIIENNNDNNKYIIQVYDNWKINYINLLEQKYYNLYLEYNRILNFHKNLSNKDFEESDYEYN